MASSVFETFVTGQLAKVETLGRSIVEKVRSSPDTINKLKKFADIATDSRVGIGATAAFVVYTYWKSTRSSKNKQIDDAPSSEPGSKRKRVNKLFMKNLKSLLKILIPSFKSKEMIILVLHTAFLVSRTFLSIYIASLDGAIVRSLVDRNGKKFVYLLILWFAVAIPSTTINSMIKYMESKLSLAFRTRLTRYTYDLYMKNEVYYRVTNLDSRVPNADQCLTEDVSRFCNQLAHLHSQLSKPILDIALISAQLLRSSNKAKGSGISSTIMTALVMYTTAKVLQLCQPPFGKLAAQQGELEGDLRYVHSRLITNSEEISFYRGDKIESSILMSRYMALVKHMNKIFKSRIFYGIMEGFFMKYVWGACGLLIIAIPSFFFDPEISLKSSEVISDRTQSYVTSKMLLTSGAEAIERIMLAFKEVNELAGYTSRVANMIEVFEDVKNERYQKTMVRGEGGAAQIAPSQIGKGTVTESGIVKFDHVPIVSPNGDILVENMSFEAQPGMHLLITGPNGCGKSSLFRILGGLWPVNGGSVLKPHSKDMFYIPQRPYLSLGTLRDQVIYPDTVEDMKAKGITDKDLEDILSWVNLMHIQSREGGWEAVSEWKDVLSGGEKQRLGMARVFYHRPRYAILDECTSAVSMDVEGKMYQHAIDEGITLLTVTHRPSLWKYHNHLLQFDGEGGVKFSSLNAGERLSFKEEKSKIESELAGVPKMQTRLRELCVLLGEESVVLKATGSAAYGEEEGEEVDEE